MRRRLVSTVLPQLLPAFALAGCEIIASFDRKQIKVEEPDVLTLLTGDGEVLGGGRDAAALDGGLFDGATTPPDSDDADVDAGDDASVEEDDSATADADVADDADTDAAPDVDASVDNDAGEDQDAAMRDADALDAGDAS